MTHYYENLEEFAKKHITQWGSMENKVYLNESSEIIVVNAFHPGGTAVHIDYLGPLKIGDTIEFKDFTYLVDCKIEGFYGRTILELL